MLDAAELTKRLNAQLDAAYNEYDAAKAKGDEAGMKMALARQEILIPAISLLALGAYDRAVALLAAKGVEFERKAAAVRASPLPAPATDPFEPPEKVEFSDAQLDAAAAKQPSAEPAKVAAGKPAGWSEDYQTLWDTMEIRAEWRDDAEFAARKAVENQKRYAAVVSGTTVPWWFVAIVHCMECGFKFDRHLLNGDPLSGRTVRVPANQPPFGSPPYDWETAARYAMTYEELDKITDWSLPNVLNRWHRYNGVKNEYRRRKIPTPYLWSGCYHYDKGKYTRDRYFDPEVPSKQVGAAIILKTLIEMGAVSLGATNVLKANPLAATENLSLLSHDLPGAAFKSIEQELAFPGALKLGSSGAGVKRLQEWLHLNGYYTSVDGDFGASTETMLDRFAKAQGRSGTTVLDEELWAVLTAPLRRAVAKVVPGASFEKTVLKVARQHIAERPKEAGGNNCGPWVRAYMRGADGADQLWCAGFVSLIFEQAARDMGIKVPLKRQAGVDALVADAKTSGRFIAESEVNTALLRASRLRPGYLFVIRKDAKDWTHVGFVLSIGPTSFDTIEGNTGGEGGVDGDEARQNNRSYPSRDFIRLI
ncbi:peptidoglycan-binding protein [Agrobacterium deltaense]